MTSRAEIASCIDHALLTPSLNDVDLAHGLIEARNFGVASVCIMPYALPQCVQMLQGSQVKPSTVIGYPHGGHSTATKSVEALEALEEGAQELDMVVNISRVLSDDWAYVKADIQAVLSPTEEAGEKLKVIFENAYLDDRRIIKLAQICGDLGVDWIKTSTGFGPSGATVQDVELMRRSAPAHVQVKASGGIRTLEDLQRMRAAGATRIGTSSTQAILAECSAP